MKEFRSLLSWAAERGVNLHGIEPRRYPGRGLGLVATRAIRENKIILEVPISCLRTIDSVSKTVTKRLQAPRDITVHGLLAADLIIASLLDPESYSAWNSVVPTRNDVFSSLPLTWSRQLKEQLPFAARELLQKQSKKFEKDWTTVSEAFKDWDAPDGKNLDRRDYLYAWLLVNTRTFYFATSAMEIKLGREDRIALQPVADLFNHSHDGNCAASFDATESFVFTTTRPVQRDEELTICYGRHTNDQLLVEYGFVPTLTSTNRKQLDKKAAASSGDANSLAPLNGNKWDELRLDSILNPHLAGMKHLLAETGFWGNYTADAATVCHRTQVALRAIVLPAGNRTTGELALRTFIKLGEDSSDHGDMQKKADNLLAGLLKKYLDEEIMRRIGEMDAMEEEEGRWGSKIRRSQRHASDDGRGTDTQVQREMICRRWRQMGEIVDRTLQRLKASL